MTTKSSSVGRGETVADYFCQSGAELDELGEAIRLISFVSRNMFDDQVVDGGTKLHQLGEVASVQGGSVDDSPDVLQDLFRFQDDRDFDGCVVTVAD